MAKDADPRSEFERLGALLEGGLPTGLLLRGEAAWFREQGLERARGLAEAKGIDICSHDLRDPDASLAKLQEDLRSQGLFGSERCVIVREVDAALKKVGGKDSATTRAMLAFLAAGEGALVVSSSGLRKDHAVAKAVVKGGGGLFSFRSLYAAHPPWQAGRDPRSTELCGWLLGRARERGVQLDPDRALIWIAALGNDLFELDAQVERTALGGDAPDQALGLQLEARTQPWTVADDLCSGKVREAVLGIETLFRGGMESSGRRDRKATTLTAVLLGSLRSKVRQGLAGHLAMAGGLSIEQAAEVAGVSGAPMARRSFQGAVESRPRAAWEAMFKDVLELDRRSKSGARVDANDFTRLALRWAQRPGSSGGRSRGSGSRSGSGGPRSRAAGRR